MSRDLRGDADRSCECSCRRVNLDLGDLLRCRLDLRSSLDLFGDGDRSLEGSFRLVDSDLVGGLRLRRRTFFL